MANISRPLLIVEDDIGIQSQLRWCFESYDVSVCGDREEAVTLLRRTSPGVVILDLGLPPDPGGVTEGLETLKEILTLSPQTKIIVVTGDNNRENAIKAIDLGAYDFYQKPIEPDILSMIVNRAYQVHLLEAENQKLKRFSIQSPIRNLVTNSPEMLKACRKIEKVAPSNITTLLLGASGTGKELLAQALHELSPRADKKMVAINCAAIPANLLESELFGYEKGAFTGAQKQTPGKIEYADGGTLLLDEIGDLPQDLQSKLLRFLQERVIERVGGRVEIPVDVRIVCATHQDLKSLIESGNFREDLYYRISEITIRIPPLKEREGDPLLLAKVFLDRYAQEMRKGVKGFTEEALAAIESYDWPGNVRELQSRVKRALIMAEGGYVTLDDLELESADQEPAALNLKEVREFAESKAIVRALNKADNNISEAAKMLGVTRPTLYTLLEKYNLKPTAEQKTATN